MTAANFRILYDGPALKNHEMEIRELAPALLAFSDMIEEANSIVNGEKVSVSVQVKGSFRTGSFGIDLIASMSFSELISRSIELLTGHGFAAAGTLVTVLGLSPTKDGKAGVLHLLKWLRGRKITAVKIAEDGNIRIFVDNEMFEVEQRVYDCFRNYKIRKSFEGAIARPLEREGIDTFAVAHTDGTFEVIEKEQRRYFTVPADKEPVRDETQEVDLQLLTVNFREGKKWLFSDGSLTFMATVSDEVFINRVQHNQEGFLKDDILRVKLRRLQWTEKGELKSEYEVLSVMDHRRPPDQLQLPPMGD